MKISLGSATHRPGPDWTLVDVDPYLHPDICSDIIDFILPEESCEEIYVSHALEHFSRDMGKELVFRWVRMLKEGGTLWIAVPDIEIVSKMVDIIEDPSLKNDWIKIIYGWQVNIWDIHKWGYTNISLYNLMEEAGLSDIEGFKPWVESSTGEGMDCSGAWLPNTEGSPVPFSLNLKGVK
jgi:predicted SAM-dependent methyltransferase